MKTRFLFALLAVVAVANQAFAEDDLSINICAAVFPCKIDGTVLEEFRDGDCADFYQEQCSQIATSSLGSPPSMAVRFAQCRSTRKDLRSAISKRDRKIAELRAKINELENQLATR